MQFEVFDLGLVDFRRSWEFQKEIFANVKNGLLESGLILCQHYPVITLGRTADRRNILLPKQELRVKGIQVYEIERGGEVTYHGPGQLMVYPIFNLSYFKRDIHFFLRKLEAIAIQTLSAFGISGERKSGSSGVWVGEKKIASIGIAIKNWITYHGLALNIKSEDLVNFSLIRPCGMDIIMTSMESVLKRKIEFERIKKMMIERWQND